MRPNERKLGHWGQGMGVTGGSGGFCTLSLFPRCHKASSSTPTPAPYCDDLSFSRLPTLPQKARAGTNIYSLKLFVSGCHSDRELAYTCTISKVLPWKPCTSKLCSVRCACCNRDLGPHLVTSDACVLNEDPMRAHTRLRVRHILGLTLHTP